MVTYLAEIRKTDSYRIVAHFHQDFSQICHKTIIPIVILIVNGGG
jgi:hypothetical protein